MSQGFGVPSPGNFRLKESQKRILFAVAAVIALVAAFRALTEWITVKDMTEEEKEAYYMAQEEDSGGYHYFASSRLTDEEETLIRLVHAMADGDTGTACALMGVPDTFGEGEFGEWAESTGVSSLYGYSDKELAVVSAEEEFEETVNFTTVSYTETAYYAFVAEDTDVRVRFVYEYGYFHPDGGITEDYVLLAPVEEVYAYGEDPETGEDLSAYAVSTAGQPFDGWDGWSTTWYRFEFPYFLDCGPSFRIKTDYGVFESIFIAGDEYGSGGEDGAAIAVIPAAVSDEILGRAALAVEASYMLLQEGAGTDELSQYIISSDVLGTLSETNYKYQTVMEGVSKVTGCEFYLDGEAYGTLPAEYNFRVAEKDGVIAKVDALVSTTEGDCRRVAALHLRYLDGAWKVTGMETADGNNLFTDISVLDPQW